VKRAVAWVIIGAVALGVLTYFGYAMYLTWPYSGYALAFVSAVIGAVFSFLWAVEEVRK